MKVKHVVVLMGGISPERDVSLRSGSAVAKALMAAGFDVSCIDVKDESVGELDQYPEIDVAFIALHGYFGEDGGVQHLLESKGIPYTGSGVEASKLAMDKLAAKKRFIAAGLSTPEYTAVMQFQEYAEILNEARKLGFPVVLKPPRNGSSLGISILKDENGLERGLKKAFEFGCELLIEKYVRGREFTIGILDDQALPIVEVKPAVEFFDYEAKYKDDRTKYLIVETMPDVGGKTTGNFFGQTGYLSPLQYRKAQDLAVRAHQALGCRGFSRVDLLLDEGGKMYLLEVNTIPGFTEKSLLPKAAKAAGITFPALCGKIVALALQNVLVPVHEHTHS